MTANTRPKPDAQLDLSLKRIRGTPEIERLRSHLLAVEQYHLNQLVVTTPEKLGHVQGLVTAYRELSSLLSKE